MEERRITLRLEEGLAGNQLHILQALDLELPEQYSTCLARGLRLLRLIILMLLQMVAVGTERLITPHQVALAAAAAAPKTKEDQAI